MKVNFNKKTIEEFGVLTKLKKDCCVRVTKREDEFAVEISIMDGTSNSFITNKIGEITKLFDARNWNTVDDATLVAETIVKSADEGITVAAAKKETTKIEQETAVKTTESDKNCNEEQVSTDVEVDSNPSVSSFKLFENINFSGKTITYLGSDVKTYKSKSAMFRALYELGLEICEIAKLSGSHYSFVYGVINNGGGISPSEPKTTKSDKIREMYIAGKTANEISKELGAHYSFVHTVIKKYKERTHESVQVPSEF